MLVVFLGVERIFMWDPNYFVKEQIWCDDWYIVVQGKWVNSDDVLFMINIYGPQESIDKIAMWNRLLEFKRNHDDHFVIFEDLNEVRDETERYGTKFNVFNSFINDAGLFELALGGRNFTWMNKAGTKMSKLDRFLISHRVMDAFTDVKVTALPRGWNRQVKNVEVAIDIETKIDSNIVLNIEKEERVKLLKERDDLQELEDMDLVQKPKFEALDSLMELSPVVPFASLSQEDNIELEKLTYWELLKEDVGKVVRCVFDSFVMPKGVNSSFITLIPKISNPIHIKDFRPISLIGMQYKIITKILANRLSKVIHKVVWKPWHKDWDAITSNHSEDDAIKDDGKYHYNRKGFLEDDESSDDSILIMDPGWDDYCLQELKLNRPVPCCSDARRARM
ncbi:RNA-directed DNA polymerase, eukaryota, reverse transcriptase zinc-binding domain protein [Tanacetum coccineum]